VTGVSAIFNQRSRFSWALSGIFSTWRSPNNQTVSQSTHAKNSIEQSLGDDYSFPLPLADKDATLKESEITGNKAITGILQSINEEHPAIHELDDKTQITPEYSEVLEHDTKSEVKNKVDSSFSIAKNDDDDKVTHHKQKHLHIKSVPKSKESATISYSIPADHKWDDAESHKQSSLSLDNKPGSKHMSPIYIEIDDVACRDDVMCRDDVSESNSENDLYSVPVDSVNDNKEILGNNNHMHTATKDKQLAKPVSSLPIITNAMKSDCKPQGIADDTNSTHNDNDSVYSIPVDDIKSNDKLNCKNRDQREYTSPLNPTMAMNLNPSYKRVEANDSTVSEYSDPVNSVNKKDDHCKDDNSPFAAAVAKTLLNNKHKHKLVKPDPYKSRSTSTAPCKGDTPMYEELFQTAATLPHSNGLCHNLQPTVSPNRIENIAKSQKLALPVKLDDDYTMPSDDKIKLQRNPSYGDIVSDNADTTDYYTSIPANELVTPNTLEDACITYTEC